ncbi:MAG: 3-oxoacyl-[acyl-carrier protein] reductase [Blastocatellia bacterium]|nr:3-oxoacyl-[acyl-carrier protein] reductase [Blastocatellia bacterium]
MPGQSFRGFSERVALVTGGAQGISRAVALQLAAEGAYVILTHSREDEEGASVVKELREIGTLAHSFAADVADAADVERLFARVEELYGRLDLLVNCASLDSEASLAELTEAAWDATLSVNLKSVFLCARGAARLLLKRPKAAIVNLAAETNLDGGAQSAAYVAAQAGIVGLTKALARELAPRVRVNCVAVRGGVENLNSTQSGTAAQLSDSETLKPLAGNKPAPNEVARACLYLLSADASSVTGQILIVGS